MFSSLKLPLPSLLIVVLILAQMCYSHKNPQSYERQSIQSSHLKSELNLDEEPLQKCSDYPLTGYYRNGLCTSGKDDVGTHVICAVMTSEFLTFTKSKGNDLISPFGSFPGLKPGDRWCLCALRWRQAFENGKAPQVILKATEKEALRYVSLDSLRSKSFKPQEDN